MNIQYTARVIPGISGIIDANGAHDPKLPQLVALDIQLQLGRSYLDQCNSWISNLGYIPYSYQIYYSYYLTQSWC